MIDFTGTTDKPDRPPTGKPLPPQPDAMQLGTINGIEFSIPTSGGKAGKGKQATSTIQARRDSCILKQFRFTLAAAASRAKAIAKAKAFASTQPQP